MHCMPKSSSALPPYHHADFRPYSVQLQVDRVSRPHAVPEQASSAARRALAQISAYQQIRGWSPFFSFFFCVLGRCFDSAQDLNLQASLCCPERRRYWLFIRFDSRFCHLNNDKRGKSVRINRFEVSLRNSSFYSVFSWL